MYVYAIVLTYTGPEGRSEVLGLYLTEEPAHEHFWQQVRLHQSISRYPRGLPQHKYVPEKERGNLIRQWVDEHRGKEIKVLRWKVADTFNVAGTDHGWDMLEGPKL